MTEKMLGRIGAATLIAENGHPLPKIAPLRGSLQAEYKRCGKPACRCATGKPHGPYHYHRWREDAYEIVDGELMAVGRRHCRRYVSRHDAPRVLALCQLHRNRRYALRQALTVLSARRMTREFLKAMRVVEEALGW